MSSESTIMRRRLTDVAAAAAKLGVEFDQTEAARWMVAVSGADRDSAFVHDAQAGVFGHRVALVDLDHADLSLFRALAQRVRITSRPEIDSAIAIAGSAAQGKAQVFPGDYDFFERVNIRALTIEDARAILRDAVRETALGALSEPDIVLVEVNLGVYPFAVLEGGVPRAAGEPITWAPRDIVNRRIDVTTLDGERRSIEWNDVVAGPGWTYMGWIVVDSDGGRIGLAGNMIEATWESPTGALQALDGSIDPHFQEVYLEAAAIPLLTKILISVDASARAAYVDMMRRQVAHYTSSTPDFCKASKRLYNMFRLTDELEAAAYLRELFDEPSARLYEVPGLLQAADIAVTARGKINCDTVVKQLDTVIDAVDQCTEGPAQATLLADLRQLRRIVAEDLPQGELWAEMLQQISARCSALVSEYFRVRLMGLPRIATLIDSLKTARS